MRALLVGGVALAVSFAAAAAAFSPSDARLKRDINLVAPARGLELVLELEPVTYWWSEDQVVFPQGGQRIGLVAQQVAEVVPEVVEDRGGFLYVGFDQLTALIIAATQQQQALLVEQEVRLDEQAALLDEQAAAIEALQQRIEALEAAGM